MNADRDLGMAPENLDRLLIPGARKDHGHRDGEAAGDESLERHVDAVTHAGVVGADEQIDGIGTTCLPHCAGLTEGDRRSAERERSTQQHSEIAKQSRTVLLAGTSSVPAESNLRNDLTDTQPILLRGGPDGQPLLRRRFGIVKNGDDWERFHR
jgi:hypothetical protein